MKKIAFLLALVLMTSSLASCGGEAPKTEEPAKDPTPVVDTPTPETPTPETNTPMEPTPTPETPDIPDDPEPDVPEREDNGEFLTENPADFEKTFTGYENITVNNNTVAVGDLVLVDSAHPYNSDNADDLVRVKEFNSNGFAAVSTSKIHLNFTALRKLQEMNSAMQTALKVKYLLNMSAGFVTSEEQANLHADYPNEYPEKGSESDLQTGKAAIITVQTGAMNYNFRNTAAKSVADWAEENAYLYGFIFGEDIGENAKLRYVGVPHATYMYRNDLDLAGYLAVLKNGTKLQITDERGLTFTVYYVAASEGATTSVSVPTGMNYSISGTNEGGFVVTVKGICQ